MKKLFICVLFFFSFFSHAQSCDSIVKNKILNDYAVSEESFNSVSFQKAELPIARELGRFFETVTYGFDSEIKIFLITYSSKELCEIEKISQIVQHDQ